MFRFLQPNTFHYYQISDAEKEKVQTFLDSFPPLGTSLPVAKMFWEKEGDMELSQEGEYYRLTLPPEARVGVGRPDPGPRFYYLFKINEMPPHIQIEVVVLTKGLGLVGIGFATLMSIISGYLFHPALTPVLWGIWLWNFFRFRKEAINSFESILTKYFKTLIKIA